MLENKFYTKKSFWYSNKSVTMILSLVLNANNKKMWNLNFHVCTCSDHIFRYMCDVESSIVFYKTIRFSLGLLSNRKRFPRKLKSFLLIRMNHTCETMFPKPNEHSLCALPDLCSMQIESLRLTAIVLFCND